MEPRYSKRTPGTCGLYPSNPFGLNKYVMSFNSNSRNKFSQKSPTQRYLSILGRFMFLFYFALGLAIILWKDIPLDIDSNFKDLFGAHLIVYSFMRLARLWQNNFMR